MATAAPGGRPTLEANDLVTRRSALRLGVLGGVGAAAWSAPAIQSVAWAQGQGSPEPTPTPSGSTTPPTETPSPTPSTQGSATPSPTTTPTVLPTRLTRSPTPSTTASVLPTRLSRPPGGLSNTGADVLTALAIGSGLVAGGTATTVAARRVRQRAQDERPASPPAD